ncbi:MAG: DUF58 domain-containing protein [Anaerohalosphaera sp.]|nr:DUF58 domain-containing protein [Anaerohalosphaera sp.]
MNNNRRKLTQLLDADFMARLDSMDVLSKKILHGKMQGQRRSKRRGQSVEFADHRPYVAGDDLRFVDWNIYARLEQLFLKLFMEEQDLTVHIAVDVSGSVGYGEPAKSTFILKLAAALGYVSLVNNNRLTMSSFNLGIVNQLKYMRGRNYLPNIAEFLLDAEFEGMTDFDNVCKQIAATQSGTGIMIILSDFFFKEGYESAMRRIIGRGYDLYAIQVLSPQEFDPEMTGDLKLLDIEDSDVAEVTISNALIKHYKKNLSAYCAQLQDYCVRRGSSYVLAKSSDSVEMLVLNYLRKINLLR